MKVGVLGERVHGYLREEVHCEVLVVTGTATEVVFLSWGGGGARLGWLAV